jgi:hypothetical protein
LGGTSKLPIRDARLVNRAIRERWPIPASLRSTLLKRMAKLADDPNASPRELNVATKTLLEASRVNLETIAVELQARSQEQLAARLDKLEAYVDDELAAREAHLGGPSQVRKSRWVADESLHLGGEGGLGQDGGDG